jgi:hypothetical protein
MIASRLAVFLVCACLLHIAVPIQIVSMATPAWAASAADDTSPQVTSPQAIAAQIAALEDPSQLVRDKAAETLRNAAASCGGIMPGDHEEAYWASKLQFIKIGMDKAAVEKIIPPTQETQPTVSQGMGSYSVKQRLDSSWEATLYFDQNDKIYSAPLLRKSVLSVWVPPAPDFTGKWTTYFVNGQKAAEIEYKDGEYNGTYTSFYANGKKAYEQHYVNGVGQGADRGWHDNGQPSYTGQYLNDRQDGLWVWWNPDGTKQKEVTYKMGKPQ